MRSGWIIECYEKKWTVISEQETTYTAIRLDGDIPAQAFILYKAACSKPRPPTQNEKTAAEIMRMTSTPVL